MKIDLLEIDKFIKENSCLEVTDPMIHMNQVINENGLLSTSIFGKVGSNDRKDKFGYINLQGYVLHPYIYKIGKRFIKNLTYIITGEKEFFLDETNRIKLLKPGDIKKNSGTGIRWLKNNWDKITWEFTEEEEKAKSSTPKNLRRFLSSFTAKEAFLDKFIVLPAFYRDVGASVDLTNDINKMYVSLLRKTIGLKMDLQFHENDDKYNSPILVKIQNELVILMDYFIDKMMGTKGNIHKFIIGKPIDYSSRVVISAPNYNCVSKDTAEVSFDRIAIPLPDAITNFAPFIYYGFQNFLKSNIKERHLFFYNESTKTIELKELSERWFEKFDENSIRDMITLYNGSFEHRFDPVKISCVDGDFPLFYSSYIPENEDTPQIEILNTTDIKENIIIRPLNITELFYLIVEIYIKDYHLLITRYPIEDYNNQYPTKFNTIPYADYKKIIFNKNVTCKFFPKIDGEIDVKKITDTVRLFPTYTAALGADYDGDQITVKGIFLEESNLECEKAINSVLNVVGINGENIRKTSPITAHTIYNMTYVGDLVDETRRSLTLEEKVIFLEDIKEINEKTKTVINSLFGKKFIEGKIKPPKYSFYDTIKLNKNEFLSNEECETTLGIYIFNVLIISLFKGFKTYQNITFKKKDIEELENYFGQLLLSNKLVMADYIEFANQISFIGYLSELTVPGVSSGMLYASKDMVKEKEKLMKENAYIFDNSTESEKRSFDYINNIEKPLLEKAKNEVLSKVSGGRLYDVGSKPTFGNNYKNNVVGIGVIVDAANGDTHIIDHSYMDGMKHKDIPIFANSALQGSYSRGTETQDGGQMVKDFYASGQGILFDHDFEDCGTELYSEVTLESADKFKYLYRYIKIKDDDEYILLGYDNYDKYVNKKVKMRTPLFCKGKKKTNAYCRKCYGDLFKILGIKMVGLTMIKPGSAMLNLSLKKMHDTRVETTTITSEMLDKYIV